MTRIDTDTPEVIVEIDGEEYTLAERTIETFEKLLSAERENIGKPSYKLWQAELEILLGKDACRRVFPDGKKTNLDRLQRIYVGVANAFNHVQEELDEARRERLNSTVAPLTDMFRQLRAATAGSAQRTEIAKP